MLVCCQITFLILLCLLFGFLLGVYICDSQNIKGFEDLWSKITGLFKKSTDDAKVRSLFAIFGEDFKSVYEPAEDTFLLLDALEKDLVALDRDAFVFLECGSGSGTIITALSIVLKNRLMFATDVNPKACQTTRKCAAHHGQAHNIQAVQTNLAEALVDRLKHSVDVLLFNPPYVPTDEDEKLASASQIQYSWAGGDSGRKLIDSFLLDYVARLLSKPNGVAYLIALAENHVSELQDYLLESDSISGRVVMKRQTGPELLYVIKYQWVDAAKATGKHRSPDTQL